MQSLNPMNDLFVARLWSAVQARVERVRAQTDRSRGASAIEWAIITGILAMIALAVGAAIFSKVNSAADRIKTK